MSIKVRLGREEKIEDLIDMRYRYILDLKDKKLKSELHRAYCIINFGTRYNYFWDKKTSTCLRFVDFIILLSEINKRIYHRTAKDTKNQDLIRVFQETCLHYDKNGDPIYTKASEKTLKKACKCFNKHVGSFPLLTFDKLKIYKWGW